MAYFKPKMGVFDPNAYGNPMARKTNGQGLRPPDPKEAASTPSSTGIGGEVKITSNDSSIDRSAPTNGNQGDPRALSKVTQPAQTPVVDSTRRASTQSTPDQHSAINIPGFDPQSYGCPGTPSQQYMKAPESTTAAELRASHQSVRNSITQPPALLERQTEIQAEHGNPVHGASFSALGIPISCDAHGGVLADDSQCKPGLHPHARPTVIGDSSNTANSPSMHQSVQSLRPSKEGHSDQPVERPAVYETLKKPGEAPEDTLRRLQAAKKHEVLKSIHEAADRKSRNTANVGELKYLREHLVPEVEHGAPSSPAASLRLVEPIVTLRQNTPETPTPVAPKDSAALSTVDQNVSRRASHQIQRESNTNDSYAKVENNFHTRQPIPLDFEVQNGRPRSKWASKAEMKAPAWSVDSNAFGSTEDNASMCQMGLDSDLGRLIHKRSPEFRESPIVAWHGGLLEPPADWEQRPRFSNDSEAFKGSFRNWLGEVVTHTLTSDSTPKLKFERVPDVVVQDLNLHPDGIGFVPRATTVNASNAAHYDYDFSKDTFGIVKSDSADFDCQDKMDLSIATNRMIEHETAQKYISAKLALLERATENHQQYVETRKAAQEAVRVQREEYVPTEPPRPKTNLYLRPAVDADIPGMTAILNWHVENGVRTSELLPLTDSDMAVRVDMARQSKMPFIVAVERNRKNSRPKTSRRPRNPHHPIQNTNPDYSGVVKDENILGWVSATDWSCTDYVECITADLELYVAHEHRQKGIGRCLMDAILDATDRGYTRVGGYDFTVAPELRHMYSSGGMRDLHKIIFQVRTYNRPRTPAKQNQHTTYRGKYAGFLKGASSNGILAGPAHAPQQQQQANSEGRLYDREDDYQAWLKKWLESFGFEEEARMKKIGTKNQRFLDIQYLTRETLWQPDENRLPDYSQYPI